MKRTFQISFLWNSGLKPHHYLLEIGCGTLRGGIPIIDFLDRGHYVEIDSRREVLKEAADELVEHGLQNKSPTLLHSPDIAELEIGRSFEFIWAFGGLIHMTDSIVHDCLAFVRRNLATGGVFYANVQIGRHRRDGVWQEFPDVSRPIGFYSDICSQKGLSLQDMGPVGALDDPAPQWLQNHNRMLKITLAG